MDSKSESAETFAFISQLLDEVKPMYPEIIFAGNSMSSYDLNESFSGDNLKVTLLTIVFVFVILIFTFRSWGLPIPLTATIETAVLLNFSYYPLAGTNVFFFVYLIVSAIQMGATIDYAIVITTRYRELKKTVGKKEAVVESVNQAFPTIITSGTIMATAGLLIGLFVTDTLIATLGICLMRGVIISTLLVMTVMPALLYVFDKLLDKTDFKENYTLADKKAALKKLKQKLGSASVVTADVTVEGNENDNKE